MQNKSSKIVFPMPHKWQTTTSAVLAPTNGNGSRRGQRVREEDSANFVISQCESFPKWITIFLKVARCVLASIPLKDLFLMVLEMMFPVASTACEKSI